MADLTQPNYAEPDRLLPKAFDKGYVADYLSDNPYDERQQPRCYQAWRAGFEQDSIVKVR